MTKPGSRINFYFLKACHLPARKKLKAFIGFILKNEGFLLGKLSFIFCDDVYLLELNRKYLKHDFYTDILSFPLSARPDNMISGEIYISVERVKENAKELENPIQREMHRVIFHGVLHFCRHKDKSEKARTEMRSLEDKYLKRYFNSST